MLRHQILDKLPESSRKLWALNLKRRFNPGTADSVERFGVVLLSLKILITDKKQLELLDFFFDSLSFLWLGAGNVIIKFAGTFIIFDKHIAIQKYNCWEKHQRERHLIILLFHFAYKIWIKYHSRIIRQSCDIIPKIFEARRFRDS